MKILVLLLILTTSVLISGCVEETGKTPALTNDTVAVAVNASGEKQDASEISVNSGTKISDELVQDIKTAVLNGISPFAGVACDTINISVGRKNNDYEVKVECASKSVPFIDKYLFLYDSTGKDMILQSYVLMAISERDKMSAVSTALNDGEIQQKLMIYKIHSEPMVKRILPGDAKEYGGVEKTLFSVTWASQDKKPVVVSALVDVENNAVVKKWYSETGESGSTPAPAVRQGT